MSKQVEVPESAKQAAMLAKHRAEMEAHRELAKSLRPGEVVGTIDSTPFWDAFWDALEAEALPAIYKHFSDRLREVWTKAMADPAAFTPRRLQIDDLEQEESLIDWQLRAVLIALQATSTPEVDRG
jgi:hypothetical protein